MLQEINKSTILKNTYFLILKLVMINHVNKYM